MKIFKIIIAFTLLSISISSCTKDEIEALPKEKEMLFERLIAEDGVQSIPKESDE